MKNIKQEMVENKMYESITSENSVLVIIDHQIGLYTGVRDISILELKHNIIGLVKTSKVFRIPIIVTTTIESIWGPMIPELQEVLKEISVIQRTTVNVWDDQPVCEAIEKTNRKKLIMTGITTDVCLAFPAITAVEKGYDVYAVVDASGSFTVKQGELGVIRMVQAGVKVVGYSNVIVEILKDNANPLAIEVYSYLDMPFANLVHGLNHYFSKK
ncbi:MAG TPA: isochorismatase family protein [Candidatus Babeliales bacterium]|jgi:nicotinamidase-related amidase|nr:isochorismatase family protein [Candidatus Babeliales bacterium]